MLDVGKKDTEMEAWSDVEPIGWLFILKVNSALQCWLAICLMEREALTPARDCRQCSAREGDDSAPRENQFCRGCVPHPFPPSLFMRQGGAEIESRDHHGMFCTKDSRGKSL